MDENYTKDIKESVYHGAVVSALAVGYTILGKTLIMISPPSLSKFDTEDGWCKISGYHSTIQFYEGLSNQAKNNS